MIAVIQRAAEASVSVGGNTVGKIGKGLCILLGVHVSDTEQDAEVLAKKIINLRIFEDENGKMNLSVLDVSGQALVVSNFTLLASYKKGNRPDYMAAARPDEADRLYEYFASHLGESVGEVQKGIFGADMKLSILNDGPVTIVMDSKVLLNK